MLFDKTLGRYRGCLVDEHYYGTLMAKMGKCVLSGTYQLVSYSWQRIADGLCHRGNMCSLSCKKIVLCQMRAYKLSCSGCWMRSSPNGPVSAVLYIILDLDIQCKTVLGGQDPGDGLQGHRVDLGLFEERARPS